MVSTEEAKGSFNRRFFYRSKYPTNITQTNRFRSGRLSDMLCPYQNDLSLTKLWFT